MKQLGSFNAIKQLRLGYDKGESGLKNMNEAKSLKPGSEELKEHDKYFKGQKKSDTLEFKVSGKKQPKNLFAFFDNNLTTKEF